MDFVDKYTPVVMNYIVLNLDADVICKVAKLCPTQTENIKLVHVPLMKDTTGNIVLYGQCHVKPVWLLHSLSATFPLQGFQPCPTQVRNKLGCTATEDGQRLEIF